jgi:uncharacterized protein YciI
MPAAAGQVTAATAEPAQLNSVAAAAQTTPPASAAAQTPPPGMTTYYVALLRRGPKWVATITPEVNQVLEGHQAHVRRLASDGKLLLGGPFLDQSGATALVGMFLLQAGSLSEAQQLVDSDPAVQAGRFVSEVLPWVGPKSLLTLGGDAKR